LPRVSIVIPSYNHARFLEACIGSVQEQIFSDWEIILIDDGSTDRSIEIAAEIARTESRLRVLRNEVNLGTYGTEAKGVELSSGEFIAILNSDDVWEPTKLAKQVEMLDEHPEVPLCYTLGWLVDDSGTVHEEDVHADWPLEQIQDPLPFLLWENRILASSVLFRREAATFDPSLRYSGDWVALLKSSVKSPLACIPERLSHWRQHDNNSYLRSEGQVNEEIRVRRSIVNRPDFWYVPRLDLVAVKSGLVRCALNWGALEVMRGDMGEARKACIAALKVRPASRSALKRLALSFMPARYARYRLWKNDPTRFSKQRPSWVPVSFE
jgi:glycosyltransferase involved in cell wall biosynthesis